MKKHIVIIIDQLESGGAPVVVNTLALALQYQGYAVTLIALSDALGAEMPGIRQLALPHRSHGILGKWRRYQDHAAKLDELLDTLPPADLVLAHLHYSHQVIVRSRRAQLAWLCIHTNPAIELLGNRRGLDHAIKQHKVRALYSGQRVVGVSKGIIDSLINEVGVKPRKAITIYNPIDSTLIQHLAKETVEWQDYVVYVGRLSLRQKRYDRLLQAYLQSGIEQPLLLVGGGEQQQVETLIEQYGLQNKVILIGPTDNPYKYMHHARALLLCSDYEGLPTVIIESFICNTPVVSTDCPSGPAELMLGEQARFLIPLGDEDRLAQAMRAVIAHPPKLDKSLFTRFAPDHIASQYACLLEEL